MKQDVGDPHDVTSLCQNRLQECLIRLGYHCMRLPSCRRRLGCVVTTAEALIVSHGKEELGNAKAAKHKGIVVSCGFGLLVCLYIYGDKEESESFSTLFRASVPLRW